MPVPGKPEGLDGRGLTAASLKLERCLPLQARYWNSLKRLIIIYSILKEESSLFRVRVLSKVLKGFVNSFLDKQYPEC